MIKPANIPRYIRIAVPSPLRRLFDYLPLTDKPLPWPGSRVRVGFGRSEVVGIVISIESETDVKPDKLKPVLAVLDEAPLLDKELLALYRWASRYYMFPEGMALQTSLPKGLREGKPLHLSGRKVWQLSSAIETYEPEHLQRAPLQQKVVELLQVYKTLSTAELAASTGKSVNSALKTLQEKGLVSQSETFTALPATSSSTCKALTLNEEQEGVLSKLSTHLDSYSCTLLEGITGSGKTEIYLQLIASVLSAGKQALVLVPEISLTPQTLERFTSRFNCTIVAFHSGLTDKQRFEGWIKAHSGKADIIIGTRSAIFSPLPRPGLIIIDEEHDDSYKQQEGFRYCARDVAVYRANQLNIPVLLGTATPSLESLHNALSGRYQHLELTQRAGNASVPPMQLLDMKLHKTDEGCSTILLQQMREQLQANQQVLVFLNRRGFAPVLQCLECGWIAECPRCERSYTLHQQPSGLRCHHCDASKPMPTRCPSCHGHHLGGIGMGTERTEALLQHEFPDFPVIRIDSDTTRTAGSLQEMMNTIHTGMPCILIGTQMLAKGHHFPRVTLVAILDADSGLFSANFRGQENLGQLLTQVAGRAGRSDNAGKVLIQSFHPDHPSLQTLINEGYGSFARQLLQERRAGELPPFSRLLLLRAEAVKPNQALAFLHQAREQLHGIAPHLLCYGPMPSPIGKKAGLYRAQLIIQSASRAQLQKIGVLLIAALESLPDVRKVRWSLDVDPLDFS